jgi:uncharacterized protein (TIGR02284 family)
MDFSKLSQNEKLATYGAAAVIIGGIVAASTWGRYGIAWLGVLAAVGMLAIIFLPQLSPNTKLPGSNGSLMLVAGGAAAVILVLGLLINIGFTFNLFGLADLFWLIAVAGGVVMGWAGWQAFQAEGVEPAVVKELMPFSDETNPEEIGTRFIGDTFKMWMDLKAAVTNGGKEAMLGACVTGEMAAIRSYENNLEENLPMELRNVIVRQLGEIKSAYENIKSKKEAL